MPLWVISVAATRSVSRSDKLCQSARAARPRPAQRVNRQRVTLCRLSKPDRRLALSHPGGRDKLLLPSSGAVYIFVSGNVGDATGAALGRRVRMDQFPPKEGNVTEAHTGEQQDQDEHRLYLTLDTGPLRLTYHTVPEAQAALDRLHAEKQRLFGSRADHGAGRGPMRQGHQAELAALDADSASHLADWAQARVRHSQAVEHHEQAQSDMDAYLREINFAIHTIERYIEAQSRL